MPKPLPPSGGVDQPGEELTQQQQLEALIRIMNGGKPGQTPPAQPNPPGEAPDDNNWDPHGGCFGTGGWKPGYEPKRGQATDPFPNHTINQEGADANQAYAEMLVRDSDTRQTAGMLKRAIDDYGNQGRGDVADLLARFQKIDGVKAETLRREIHKATGEMLPYRLAPLGEGFREPTEEEKIAAAPKAPFGSAQGADRWAAGNMADALLGKGDYADAITHFRGEIGRNQNATMPYLAAVHEIMEKAGGSAALDKIDDKLAAGALADSLYRHGSSGGTKLVQTAINQVNGNENLKVDGGMGKDTLDAYSKLVSNPETRDKLLNTLADLRDAATQGNEKDRMDHYRSK